MHNRYVSSVRRVKVGTSVDCVGVKESELEDFLGIDLCVVFAENYVRNRTELCWVNHI